MAHWHGYMRNGWYAIGVDDEDINHYQWFETQEEVENFVSTHLEEHEEWTIEHWDKDTLVLVKTFT